MAALLEDNDDERLERMREYFSDFMIATLLPSPEPRALPAAGTGDGATSTGRVAEGRRQVAWPKPDRCDTGAMCGVR